jgi:hypothetical protein
MAGEHQLIGAALRIGRRIAGQALWQEDRCTWPVVPERSTPELVHGSHGVAGGGMYKGTAGTALFLLELGRVTGDPLAAKTAEGAIRHALADPNMPVTRFGFYSGRVGVACAAARAGALLGREDLLAAAERTLAPLVGHEHEDIGDDVIAGAAGSIPALLRLSTDLPAELTKDVAVRLGERLIVRAYREPTGWSWGDVRQVTHARHLCGYAHGASGIGHALLELWAATGDARFRFAAEQAFAYERQFFSAEAGEWPDLRHKVLGEYGYERRLGDLRARLAREGGPLPFVPRFMTAWCYGAAGIAPTRLRAWQLLGTPVYRAEAEAGLATTAASLEYGAGVPGSYSLCHGVSGNADPLLEAARVLARPELRERAREAALAAAAGAPGSAGEVDSALLVGEAGLGYFLLRVADADTPSVLCITTAHGAPAADAASLQPARELHRESIAAYFGTTMALLDRLPEGADVLSLPLDDPSRATVDSAVEPIRRAVAAVTEPGARERLADAFAFDLAFYERTRAITDFTLEYQRSLLPPTRFDPDSDRQELRLAPESCVVQVAWDWPVLLEDAASTVDVSGLPRSDAYYLLYRAQNQVRIRRLNPLSALVLHALQEAPRTFGEVVDQVAAALPQIARAEVHEKVREQLARASATGLVTEAGCW